MRLYCLSKSSWVSGVIERTDEKNVTLTDYEVEDTAEKGERIEIGLEDIQKAKLEYKWEDMKNVRVK